MSTADRELRMATGRRPVLGVMGAGESARDVDLLLAERIGELAARDGWVLLTGGRPYGVMAAATRGAKRIEGSLVIGILPGTAGPVAEGVDVAVFTAMGGARNNINVLSSDVVVACGHGGAGTASEIALAVKAKRPVILLAPAAEAAAYFRALGRDEVIVSSTPEEAMAAALDLVRRH